MSTRFEVKINASCGFVNIDFDNIYGKLKYESL